MHLVPVETIEIGGVTRFRLPEHEWRHREGFALTDPGMDLTHAWTRPPTASSATTRPKTVAARA